MRYSISEPLHFEEATPRGLVTRDFPAGEIDVEDLSDDHFLIEMRLIPAGLAARVAETAPEPEPSKGK